MKKLLILMVAILAFACGTTTTPSTTDSTSVDTNKVQVDTLKVDSTITK